MKDIFSKDITALKQKKLWLFDMDGTIYNENTLFEGVLELMAQIRSSGGKYVFITNNSSKSVKEYIDKITKMGIEADESNFFTSVQATVLMLKQKHQGALVYCQCTSAMLKELQAAGIRTSLSVSPTPDVVLCGFDTEITGEKLRNTCEILTLHDLPYYATNPDVVCPVSFGYIPDCGSVSVMIKNATGKMPVFIGKPEPTMVNIARSKFGCSAEETVVIGDRVYTDIASGYNAGVDTVCVLSGEATLADIEASEIKPTFVLNSVKDIYSLLK